ncbi:yacP-like NYN domain protein [Rhynchospora pubera]|uniref:YacP-like NYN domain protein n=1 Tax=Rhynchospora pubera TaxID=906938 RepID=A0AAV8G466_9POAL|nr:yacP-like NYN domain protein [Rhynchospora pubera]
MRTAVYSSYSLYPVVEARNRKHNPKFPKDKDKDAHNTARRITSNVKQNLQFLKLKEQRSATKNTPIPATRYRRKKGDNKLEETDLKIEPGEEDTTFDNSIQEWETGELVVLVDAYNLCGHWKKLKPDFTSGRLSSARGKLIDYLVMYNEVREFKVVAVFDAVKSGRRTHKENVFGVDIIYTGGIEADDWILREVESLKKAGSPVLVVTSDIFMISELLLLGASVWNCDNFVTEIRDAELEYREIIKRDRVREKKSKMPVKYDMPLLAVPALESLKKKLVDEDLSNAPESETLSTPDPTTTDLHSSNKSNGSLRKKSVQIVKLKKRRYGSYHTLHDLKRRISEEE